MFSFCLGSGQSRQGASVSFVEVRIDSVPLWRRSQHGRGDPFKSHGTVVSKVHF